MELFTNRQPLSNPRQRPLLLFAVRVGQDAFTLERACRASGQPSAPEAPAGNAGSALRVALDGGGEAAQLCRQWLVCAEPGLGLGDVGVEDLKPHALHAVRPVDN